MLNLWRTLAALACRELGLVAERVVQAEYLLEQVQQACMQVRGSMQGTGRLGACSAGRMRVGTGATQLGKA